jgi:hypothetical protein
MNKSLRLLLIGLGLAITILGIGAIGAHQSKSRIALLVGECQAEAKKPRPDGFELDCDPIGLLRTDNGERNKYGYKAMPGIQGSIALAQRRLGIWENIPFPFVAAITLIFLGLPWAWYFILARVKELREALVGK